MRGLLFLFTGLLVAVLAPASAISQYRDNQPAVLQAPQEPNAVALRQQELTNRFWAGYTRQGQPRIAIFWNQRFSDRITQWVVDSRDIEAKDQFVREDEPGAKKRTVEGFYTERRVPEPTRRGLRELATFEFESGYTDPLLAMGTTILDRSAIMRLTQRNQDRNLQYDRVSDVQAIETDALLGHADFLVELLMTPKPAAPLGVSFRISILEVRSGRLVTSFVSDGTPLQDGNRKWVAGKGGFNLDQPSAPGPEEVGRALAFDTMEALGNVWR